VIKLRYSFGLLKPDCIERGIEKEVLATIEPTGLKILVVKIVTLTQKEIDIVYERCKSKDFYEKMSKFLSSGRCLAFIAEGTDAIRRLNDLVGHFDPMKAKEGSLRRCFGKSPTRNIIHSSMNEQSFWREVLLFFNKKELKHLSITSETGRKRK